jgi:type VI secretion system protein VasI
MLRVAPALADDPAPREPATCAALKKDSDRLECYDLLFKKVETNVPSSPGDWQTDIETSKIDDSQNVLMSLSSKDEIGGMFGQQTTMIVHIACREKKTDFYISFGDNFMSDIEGYGDVTLRIDNAPALKKSMVRSTDNKALGLWSPNAVSFIKTLLNHEHLLVRATPYNGNALTSEFEIKGLDTAIKPLRSACKW